MAETLVFDEHGAVGRAVLSVVVQPHRRPFGSERQ
jgi:hypothetical protein